jgi:hypothetical protein
MICPPDVLCRWLRQEERWESMEELALALERETLNSIGGRPVMRKKVRRRKSRLQATYKIERMMSLACPKRRRLG